MSSTGGARGERTFKAGDRDVTVLYTNRALAAVEKRLGKGIVGIVQGIINGASGLGDVAVILQEGMEAARKDAKLRGNQVSLDDAYAVMDVVGFGSVSIPVMEAVAEVLAYKAPSEDGGEDPNS